MAQDSDYEYDSDGGGAPADALDQKENVASTGIGAPPARQQRRPRCANRRPSSRALQ